MSLKTVPEVACYHFGTRVNFREQRNDQRDPLLVMKTRLQYIFLLEKKNRRKDAHSIGSLKARNSEGKLNGITTRETMN